MKRQYPKKRKTRLTPGGILALLCIPYLFALTNLYDGVITKGFMKRQRRFLRSLIFNDLIRNLVWPVEKIHYEWHPSREDRFPSVEERVKFYMGVWGAPPEDPQKKWRYKYADDGKVSVYEPAINNNPEPIAVLGTEFVRNKPIVATVEALEGSVMHYNLDIISQLLIPQKLMHGEGEKLVPIIGVFGDGMFTHPFPHFAKARPFVLEEGSSILAKLVMQRWWGWPVQSVIQFDVPWNLKVDQAIWRGAMSGCGKGDIKVNTPKVDYTKYDKLSENERFCLACHKCSFVLKHLDSDIVDAIVNHGNHLPEPDKDVFGKQVFKQRDGSGTNLYNYKAQVSFKGNDVGSGLKWMLLSKSILLLPEVDLNSWGMEELMEPWVHFVPLEWDGSDGEERMQWVLDNDMEALKISERATLFIEDFLRNKDEELLVEQETIRVYEENWIEMKE